MKSKINPAGIFALLTLLLLVGAKTGRAQQKTFTPGQPFAPHWFPNELLAWQPDRDADAVYNRGTVPLATRFADTNTQANPHARRGEARVVSLAAFGPTAQNPSQGAAEFRTYAFTYWQYTDKLVYWGGSSGEGLILTPKAGVIDAAHRNGVPVLGTLFFPPVVYGGRIQWVRDLVQRRGDTFPVGDKLIEAARYYGFDGWFFNQETAGGDPGLASDLRDLLRYMQRKSRLHIMWYDAMTQDGNVRWQGALNATNQMFFQGQEPGQEPQPVSNSMFLDFRWRPARLTASRSLAQTLGRDPYELFAGIDVEANGYDTRADWTALFPESQPDVVSLGFYRPDWTFNQAKDEADFVRRDSRFWVGANGDPANTQTTEAWKGVAHYIPETSSITRVPFVTNFNTGQGHLYAAGGAVIGHEDWNNLSLQDALPTWRWHIESDTGFEETPSIDLSDLTPALDTSEAYEGGASLKVAGSLVKPARLRLFSARLPIGKDTHLRVVYKRGQPGPSCLQIGVAFADDIKHFTFLNAGVAQSAGWNTALLDLRPFRGRTLRVISLRFASETPGYAYAIHIGQIAVLNGTPRHPSPPAGLRIEKQWSVTPDRISLRLRWKPAPGLVSCYNLYQHNADGSRLWLGGTPNTAYFVAALNRIKNEATPIIEVEAVSTSGEHSKPASIQL